MCNDFNDAENKLNNDGFSMRQSTKLLDWNSFSSLVFYLNLSSTRSVALDEGDLPKHF